MGIKCPVCKKFIFEEENDFEICDICGWENDGVQHSKPDYSGGANVMSVNQAREAYLQGKPVK